MIAKVTKPVAGVPDGKVYPVDFAKGDLVEGDLAEALIAAGKAVEVKPKKEEPNA